LKIVVYLCALIVATACLALTIEFGLRNFLPDSYRGYLIEHADGKAKWAIGPYEPSQPATGFNAPVTLTKPDNTIRIISLGTSGTEGWLSAETVFNKYGLKPQPKSLSSYSRATEFIMNQIAEPSSKKIEVINLGVAAYNITDVIRMLKDSVKLNPDMFVIQIGGNETWTAERAQWSAFFDTDIPYLYSELGYELIGGKRSGWRTLSTGGNAFNPLALFSANPQPVVKEPAGRAEGLQPRLQNYAAELERLGSFVQRKQIPTLFLIPSQNLAGFLPFGSMAKIGTDDATIEKLNQLLIAALAEPLADSKDRYLEILQLDDGIAEANFQLGTIYLQENQVEKAREHFWKANNRDLVLKRLPSDFHDISRRFVAKYSYSYIDEMKFFESKSVSGIVGYDWLDDDVHPSRKAQFDLGKKIAETIVDKGWLRTLNYAANLQDLPNIDEYDAWTGFDQEAAGNMAYLRAAHNYLAFGRFRQRFMWDPNQAEFLDPILADLEIANANAPIDQSRHLAAGLNIALGRKENAREILASMNCRSSPERSATVQSGMMGVSQAIFGYRAPDFNKDINDLLVLEGCAQ